MNKENIIIIIAFFFIMVIFFYFKNMHKLVSKKKKKDNEIVEVKYLCLTSNIDKAKLINKKMMIVFSVINALIVDFVFTIVILLKVPIFVRFIIGFVLFIGLIYSIYGILGKLLLKRGYVKK